MPVSIEYKIRDQTKNTQPSVTESITLIEAEIEFRTSNFPSEYLIFPLLDEDLKNVDEDFSQIYFWSEEWQKAESEADEDIRMNRVKIFNSVDDLITELKS